MTENVDEDKVTFDQMELDDRILKVHKIADHLKVE